VSTDGDLAPEGERPEGDDGDPAAERQESPSGAPPPDRMSEALARLGTEDRVLLELLLADGRTDEEIGAEAGLAATEVPWRRAELVNAVAQDAGAEGPEGLLAASETLRGLVAKAPERAPEQVSTDGDLAPEGERPEGDDGDPAAERQESPSGARGALIARRIGLAALLASPGALTVYLGVSGGGFFAGTTGFVVVLLIVALVLRITLAERPFEGFGPGLAVAAAALGLFAVWTLLSFTWSDSQSRALLEFNRALLYLLVLVLGGSLLRTSERLRWMVRAIVAGIVVVCGIGLISRVLPEVWPIAPNIAEDRLSYPLTYWNALGLLAALGIVLALLLTSDERESRPSRVLAAGVLPMLGATLLLTFSRGAILAAAIGVVAFAVLGRPRGLLPALVAVGPATAIAVVLTFRADLLGTRRYTTEAAVAQGQDAAIAIALCMAAALLLRVLLLPADGVLSRIHLPARIRRPVIGGATASAVLIAVTVALALDAPGYLDRQYERFLDGSGVATATTRVRLTNPGNNGRTDLWKVARDAWEQERVHGAGAGVFQTLWTRHRPTKQPATDGHSLYLEVLAELGLIGLALLAVAFAAILGRLAYLARGPDRALYAGVLAAGVAWACHAGIDWDWEMPAVTLPFFALGGLALARDRARLRAPGRPLRVALGIGLLVMAVTPALVAVSQTHLDESVRAFEQGDCETAIDSALSSASTLSVRPEPYEILGYCDARRRGAGSLAVQMMEEAVERDPDNWEFRYGLALVRGAAGLDPRPAAREAQRLNPRNELTADAVRRFETDDPVKWGRRARTARLPF
jgi:O-antigen ligase